MMRLLFRYEIGRMSKSCLEGSSTPAYKGTWHGHHGGTGANIIWSPRLSPIQWRVLQGNPPWAYLRIHHKLLRPVPPWGSTGSPGRLSAIPPPWATLACWFRTTTLVYIFGISPTRKEPSPKPASLSPFSPSLIGAQPSWWACNGEVLGGCEKRASARKKKQWQRRRSNELVNSKIKRVSP
jgi:hypothetical protein